ncbi:MAG: alkane 1-monooxygenase [Sphingomonadaceae bacterium]|nr:alkane 1-monooxygenase [Sphingomonadaceae bacterium]
MRHPVTYFVALVIALTVVGGFYLGGFGFYAVPIAGFVLLPPIDVWRGHSRWPSEKALARLSDRAARLFERALPLAAWTSIGLLAWALWAVSVTPLAWWQLLGLILSIATTSGLIGIVVAHELMHRSRPGQRRLGFLLMALVGYAHFCVEHVRGHHARVATREDPATARAGESIYAFVPRSIFQGLVSGWRLEAERLRRVGRPVLSVHNDILVWHLFTLALALAIWWLLGPTSLLLFVAQAVLAVTLLEMINYIEHYGLLRTRGPDGAFERVRPAHSWNSSHLLTNVNLFNLGRHSDHHQQSNRPFYKLRHHDEAPQLPYGYSGMFLLALVPPLWFRIMDSELAAFAARGQAAVDEAPRSATLRAQ